MNPEQKLRLTALFEHLKEHPEEIRAHIVLAEKHGATFSFAQAASGNARGADTRPADAPPLWAERKTGREVSPVDWIKMHYGRTLEDGSWDPMGLSRKTISNLDHPLYQALATWLVRHPDDAFDTPPARRPRAKTPDEAVARRVQVSREAQARFRQKHLEEHPEEIPAHIVLAKKHGATFPFAHAASGNAQGADTHPADAPPLWAKRKAGWNEGTGEKASPALWIKMHYGNKDPKNWDPMGLARAHLRHDRPLYDAYAKWVLSPNHEDLGLPSEPRQKVADPVLSLDRHRESSLSSYHKRR